MNNRIKRTNDELKAARPTLDEVKFIPRVPVSILVENVRSVHNVGSIFRSADGFGAEKIFLTGYTAYPPRDDLHKTALGAEDAVPWEHFENPVDAVTSLKENGITLALVEQTTSSTSIYLQDFNFPICFIVGNEVTGVSEEVSALADIHLEIPMRGIKQSLNVSVATGVVGYELARAFCIKTKKEF
jgi:tRNA G18 (ribose-2'-O)-methylase SpoU